MFVELSSYDRRCGSTKEDITMSKLDKYTDRGFKWYKPVGKVTVYESSSAEQAKLWIKIDDGSEAITDLTLSQALELSETLSEAVRNHYQERL
jgi:hypothetical protein